MFICKKKKGAQILQTFDAREGMHVRIETILLENILVLFCDFRSIALVPQFPIMLI